jgi:hypothetical protein
VAEATWGEDAKNPEINWRMSAALENVPRGGDELAEVTSLEGALRAWLALDAEHRRNATLTPEHPVMIEGEAHKVFSADGIALLAEHLPHQAGGA